VGPHAAKAVRVLIVDDQQHFRRGLRAALEAAAEPIEVVGEAGDGDEAIELTRQLSPDVVVLDVRMPRTDGIRAAQILKTLEPAPRMLMLTVSDTPEDIASATKAGASGYMLKERSLHDVVDAVLSLARGDRWPLAAG
jgi:two-component system NarL family response regulator